MDPKIIQNGTCVAKGHNPNALGDDDYYAKCYC